MSCLSGVDFLFEAWSPDQGLLLSKTALEILKATAKVRHIRSNYVFLNRVGGKINQRNVIRIFQKLGRSKTISTVTRYAHHNPESLRSGIEALDKLRENHITILSQSKEKGGTTDS
jgi:integrase